MALLEWIEFLPELVALATYPARVPAQTPRAPALLSSTVDVFAAALTPPFVATVFPDALPRRRQPLVAGLTLPPQPERTAPLAPPIYPDSVRRAALHPALHPFTIMPPPQEEAVPDGWGAVYPDAMPRARPLPLGGGFAAFVAEDAPMPVATFPAFVARLWGHPGDGFALPPLVIAPPPVLPVVGYAIGRLELVALAASSVTLPSSVTSRAVLVVMARSLVTSTPPGLTMYVGDKPRFSILFTDTDDGEPFDPSTVVLRVKAPDATVTVYDYALAEVTKTGTGAYQVDVLATQAGLYSWRWEGGGVLVAVDEGSVRVAPSAVV